MTLLEFRSPVFLGLIVLIPLCLYLHTRIRSMIQYSSLAIVDQVPPSWKIRLVHLPSILMAAALFSLVIALAGPRSPDKETLVREQGIAIMMVLDHSGSMQARDLVRDDTSVDRLAVVKEVLREFVSGDSRHLGGRAHDLIGLIAFAGYADSLCPLTLDHGNLQAMVNDLEIVTSRSEDGTALGDGLGLAVERLRNSDAESKVVILMTDGVNNAGSISPDQTGALAAQMGIKVYCIGVGSKGVAPFPSIDPFTRRQTLQPLRVNIDEKLLEQIAEQTGGRYFRATNKDVLSEIYREIDQLERTEHSETRYLQYTEHYATFVLSGLCLMGTGLLSARSMFQTLP